jgi:hypothetical protein
MRQWIVVPWIAAAELLVRRAWELDAPRLKAEYPYYHTSEEIREAALQLASQCPSKLTVREEQQADVSLTVATFRRREATVANKALFVFGEHSRELIGPESALALMQKLCNDTASDGVLNDTEFVLVLNANPNSRRKVEAGQYCLRANPAGVDLNRNWDMHWQQGTQSSGLSTGAHPFSEPETQLLRHIVEDYRPDTFISVHSGTIGLYMPWAYDTNSLAMRNEPAMMSVLHAVDENHCQCPFGAAGKEVGYACPGTCLDYVYDRLNASYAFAFEIYTSDSNAQQTQLSARYQHAKTAFLERGLGGDVSSLLQLGARTGSRRSRARNGVASEAGSAAWRAQVQATARAAVEMREDAFEGECFGLFNPSTEEEYNKVVQNWASAYIKTVELIAGDLKQKQTR